MRTSEDILNDMLADMPNTYAKSIGFPVYDLLNSVALESEKLYMNVAEYANTSSASIPVALDEMAQKGMLKKGMKVVCVGFGAGLTWGGALLEW